MKTICGCGCTKTGQSCLIERQVIPCLDCDSTTERHAPDCDLIRRFDDMLRAGCPFGDPNCDDPTHREIANLMLQMRGAR